MKQILQHLQPNQSEPASPNQKLNNAGGYSFTVTPLERLRRFLILGSDGGTYYVGEHEHTRSNIENIRSVLTQEPIAALRMIGEVSDQGLAPRNTPAIFALAVALTSSRASRYVTPDLVHKVCRIGTHWLQLAAAVDELGGWGRHKRAVFSERFEKEPLDMLAYDMAKYQQRDGWSQADLLRLSHPVTADPARHALFRWALKAPPGDRVVNRNGKVRTYAPVTEVPEIIRAMQKVADPQVSLPAKLELIQTQHLSREMIPTELLTRPEVWRAMLPAMGTTAVLRNLRNMAKMGMLRPFNDDVVLIMSRITENKLLTGRIHPVQMLQAIKALQQEEAIDSSLMAALEKGFYACFHNIKPANKRTLLALDVSASMAAPCGTLGFSCSEGSAVMAMATAHVEPSYFIMAFSERFMPLDISARDSLSTASKKVRGLHFGGTDCALPMIWALRNKVAVDTFVVYTDSETWAGEIHPHLALQKYRQQTGIDSKLVVVGMTATEVTIADPNDPGMLDVVGFDASAPALISNFSAGVV